MEIIKKLKRVYLSVDNYLSKLHFSVLSIEKLGVSYDVNETIPNSVKQNKLQIFSEDSQMVESLLVAQNEIRSQNIAQAKVYKFDGRKFKIVVGGFIIWKNKVVLKESISHQDIYFWRYKKKLLVIFRLFARKQRLENVFVASRHLDFNFWHSTCEILAELNLILKHYSSSSKLNVIVSSNYSKLHLEQIKIIFGERIQIVKLNSSIVAKKIYVTSNNFEFKEVNFSLVVIRNFNFWKGFNDVIPKLNTIKRPFTIISRRKTSNRRILNEEELYKALIQIGPCEIICLEDYSWLDQLRIINQTEVLIAAHGALSANLLFAKPLCYFEIVDLKRTRGIYPIQDVISICAFSSINHIIYDCISIQPTEDFYIDVDKILLRMLD
jgi:hypothetical protein